MGYTYGRNERGNWVLACDSCGSVGGVRKRTCPYTVRGDSLRTVDGRRHEMSYCSPPAYCGPCYTSHGGLYGVHGDSCRDGAAHFQAQYDEKERGLDAGEMYVTCGEGAHSGNDLTAGMVRITFRGRSGEVRVVMLEDVYHPGAKPRLSDYAGEVLIPA